MDTKTNIIMILQKLQHFFENHQERGWTQRSKQAIERIQTGQDHKIVLSDFVGTGMGSLTDLYICAENGHALTGSSENANKQLEMLATEILTLKHSFQ